MVTRPTVYLLLTCLLGLSPLHFYHRDLSKKVAGVNAVVFGIECIKFDFCWNVVAERLLTKRS